MSAPLDRNWHADVNAGIGVVRPAMKTIPVVGSILEGSVEALLAISKQAERARQNKADWDELRAHAFSVTALLREAIRDKPPTQLNGLKLTASSFLAVLREAGDLASKKPNWIKRFIVAASDAELIAEMRRRISDAAMLFMVIAQVRTESGVADLSIQCDAILAEQQREAQMRERRDQRQQEFESSMDDDVQRRRRQEALKPAHNAAHYSQAAPKPCTDGTRVELRATIMDWIRDKLGPRLYWLAGIAGTGKSTLAQSICKEAAASNTNVLSFFISSSDSSRNQAGQIIATLSHQLGERHASARYAIDMAINERPAPAQRSILEQTQMLLMRPLMEYVKNTSQSLVIVIDALDEGTGSNDFDHFAEAGGRDMFTSTYSGASFVELRQRTPDLPSDWPSHDQVERLVRLSGTLFVYASTVMRYICSPRDSPIARLENILRVAENETAVAKHEPSPYATLDNLYLAILNRVADPCDMDPASEKNTGIRRMFMILFLSIHDYGGLQDLSALLLWPSHRVTHTLCSLSSVLDVPVQLGLLDRITWFHKSFYDFLIDSRRCTDPRFCIPVCDSYAALSVWLFKWSNGPDLSNPQFNPPESAIMAKFFAQNNWFPCFLHGALSTHLDCTAFAYQLDRFTPEKLPSYNLQQTIWALVRLENICDLFEGFLRSFPSLTNQSKAGVKALRWIAGRFEDQAWQYDCLSRLSSVYSDIFCATSDVLVALASRPATAFPEQLTVFVDALVNLEDDALFPKRRRGDKEFRTDERKLALERFHNAATAITGVKVEGDVAKSMFGFMRNCVLLRIKYMPLGEEIK
ncbi:hypothetical protein BKA62DRAFT_834854 [Auriculariales sp. MPI-PUGE-AT-0066]|nr:hypothetical protein BKA62DRAFT_834854 [Auriculariales sp. MPI-PUGE-AT-0066]